MTPHNHAKKGEIAKAVLMAGDPLRAKWISENFLQDSKLVNTVRGMNAYTGKYKDLEITIMGHGMGIPSIGIYSWELFSPEFYDVDLIIRIGSAGSYIENIKPRDVVLVNDSWSNSIYATRFGVEAVDGWLKPSKEINDEIIETAKKENIDLKIANCYSTDVFYAQDSFQPKNVDVVEMESFGLFANAKKLNKKAACILTITDSFVDPSIILSPEERQIGLKTMVELALESVYHFYKKR